MPILPFPFEDPLLGRHHPDAPWWSGVDDAEEHFDARGVGDPHDGAVEPHELLVAHEGWEQFEEEASNEFEHLIPEILLNSLKFGSLERWWWVPSLTYEQTGQQDPDEFRAETEKLVRHWEAELAKLGKRLPRERLAMYAEDIVRNKQERERRWQHWERIIDRKRLPLPAAEARTLIRQAQIRRYLYEKFGDLLWVLQSRPCVVKAVDKPQRLCSITLPGFPSVIDGVQYGLVAPEVGKEYLVRFAVRCPQNFWNPYTAPIASGRAWIKVPGAPRWLYYDTPQVFARVDWPPNSDPLPAGTPRWDGYLTDLDDQGWWLIGGVLDKDDRCLVWWDGEGGALGWGSGEPPQGRIRLVTLWGDKSDPANPPVVTERVIGNVAVWAASNDGTALTGLLDVATTGQIMGEAPISEAPRVTSTLVCQGQRYYNHTCPTAMGTTRLSNPVKYLGQAHLLLSQDTGRTWARVGAMAGDDLVWVGRSIFFADDPCKPECLAGWCILGFLTCTSFGPAPSVVAGHTGFTSASYPRQRLMHAAAWSLDADAQHPKHLAVWLTQERSTAPPSQVIIKGNERFGPTPPGDFPSMAAFEDSFYYGLLRWRIALWDGAALSWYTAPLSGGAGNWIHGHTAIGVGWDGALMYCYLNGNSARDARVPGYIYRLTARCDAADPALEFQEQERLPVHGIAACTRDGQGLIGFEYLDSQGASAQWKWSNDWGETWEPFDPPPTAVPPDSGWPYKFIDDV